MVDNLLLSYIDVRHTNFLMPFLTVGEARDLGLRYTTLENLALVRDKSAEHVSQSRKVHVPIEHLKAQARATEPEATEVEQDANMVTRRKMTADRFLPGTHPTAQSQ